MVDDDDVVAAPLGGAFHAVHADEGSPAARLLAVVAALVLIQKRKNNATGDGVPISEAMHMSNIIAKNATYSDAKSVERKKNADGTYADLQEDDVYQNKIGDAVYGLRDDNASNSEGIYGLNETNIESAVGRLEIGQ